MLESLLIVARQVGILFALMAVGFICNKRKLLNGVAIKGITELLVLIVTPSLIVHVFQRPFDRALLGGLGWAVAAAFFAHVAGSVLALLCVHDPVKRREGVLRFATIFSNAGFMGIPLEYAILGPKGVFFGAVYVVMFNLICWSWGIVVMCGGMKDVRLRTIFINPGSVGVAIGLPFFLFSLRMPAFIGEPIRMLSDLNTPLAMIMAGWYLAEADFRPVLRCAGAYIVAVLRLAVVPLAVIGALVAVRAFIPSLDPVMAVAIATAAAAPTGALTTVIAAKYDLDVSTATGVVSGTTLLSILTMPPIVGFALWLF